MAQVHTSTVRARLLGLALTAAFALFLTAALASTAHAALEDFDFETVDATLSNHQAGAHPDVTTKFVFNGDPGNVDFFGQSHPWGRLRDATTELPAGLTGNPAAFPTCRADVFASQLAPLSGLPSSGECPRDSQVGLVSPGLFNFIPTGFAYEPLYNLESPGGDVVARLGFYAVFYPTFIDVRLDPERDNRLVATVVNASAVQPLTGTEAILWGVPTDPAHDDFRYTPLEALMCAPGCGTRPSGMAPTAYMSNPTSCGSKEIELTAVNHAGFAATPTTAPLGTIEDCETVPFDPTLDLRPTTRRAGSPSGVDVNIQVPQDGLLDPSGRASAHLKRAVVTLPEGMTVNPSAADGLGACSEAQIGLVSKTPVRFDSSAPACPESSKVGTVKIDTPLLEDPVDGALYLARQKDNPFNSLLSGYLVAEGQGLLLKLAGRFDLDPQTGRIVATFDNNPQQPFSNLDLHFKGGNRGVLVTPPTCGVYEVTSELTPWSAADPEAPTADEVVTQVSKFTIDRGPDGGACTAGDPAQAGDPADRGARPFAPDLTAGSTSPLAGEFSPFLLRVTRDDGEQEINRLRADLPPGVAAKLAGVPYCSDAALAAIPTAPGTGAAQLASPSCPAASKVGRVHVAAGAGSNPFHIEGSVYLAGPYGGAPLSVAVVTPAVAGPFDLGNVVVRSKLAVDRDDAQVHVESDVIPTILEGLPLHVRDIRVAMDRDKFTINPTSCRPMLIDSAIGSIHGAVANPNSPFGVGGCAGLGFQPRLAMRLVGPRQRRTGGHPAVRTVVRQSGFGESGIRRAAVRLPKSLALDADNANALCEFVAGSRPDLEDHCPDGSIVGRARAFSPLLDKPLVGDVYFVKNVRVDPDTGNQIRTLPKLVVALRGQIDLNLVGRSTTTKSGQLVSIFAGVPDAPISRFNLNIKGGANGILVVTRTARARIDLCDGPQLARSFWQGQNGARRTSVTRIGTPCRKSSKRGRRAPRSG